LSQRDFSVDKPSFFSGLEYEPHDCQWLFHNSNTRFRVAVCGRRFGKSVMAANDRLTELFKPNRSLGWIIGPCVDATTEILSERGWLTYDQLNEGDIVLTLNEEGLAEWQPVQKVNIYKKQSKVIWIEQRGHSSMTTPHHRWLVGYTGFDKASGKRVTRGYRFTTTEEMTKPNEFVLGGAPVINLPDQPKVKDAFVELIGWYWAEGTDQSVGNGVIITQNSGPNADSIKAAATDCFGPASETKAMRNRYCNEPRWSDWKSIRGQETCGRFGFNSVAGAILREVAPDKVIKPEFITCLTKAQLELLLDVSIKADGHERVRTKPSGEEVRERVIVQDRNDRISSLQMVAQLAGYQTTLLWDKASERYRLTIFERSRMFLGTKAAVAKRKELWLDMVWCPTTPNGTWLARRNGTVYFTGNTYDLAAKEFRVMWDSLMTDMRLSTDKRVKGNFNIRTGDMYIEMPWGARVECRSASHPETLVGEGLDWAILSEAAKQREDTWQKYIRPALSDKRGGADFVTTPEGKNWLYRLWLLGRGQNSEYESWRFPSWMNNKVYPGGEDDPEIKLMRETTIEEWFLQEIAADFTAIVGRIFGEFNEETHILHEPWSFNPDWPNYIAFDWGFTAPLAAMEFQVSPRDEIYVWREHYIEKRTLEWHIDAIKNRENPEGYRLDATFGDAADPEAVLRITEEIAPCIADPESKTWLPGIRQMKSFLRPEHDGISYDENGVPLLRPRYFVDPSCENHISEMLDYKAKKNASANEFKGSGVVANGIADHSIDAMRYGLMHLYGLNINNHLEDIYPDWAKVASKRILNLEQEAPQPALSSFGAGSPTYFSFNRQKRF
jgi:hypothetical protein